MQAKIGQILSRVVVPGWVLTGAIFKLQENSPRLLPKETILTAADKFGIDLYILLAVLIGLEFFAVAVMLCLARLARPMAIFMLSAFCLILIGEMVRGNLSSCGCLGAASPPPWMMLVIDGALLLGVALFNPSPLIPASPPRWPIFLVLVLTAGGFGWSFTKILPERQTVEPDGGGVTGGGGETGGGETGGAPTASGVPAYWFTSDMQVWVGKPWSEVDLLQFMTTKPRGLDSGKRYVVFYNRTCDHCEEMFINDLIDPTLASMTTAVEVPDSKTLMTSPNAWPMPMNDCELLELPLGCDWIMTTPVALRIVDGVVECVTEGDHRECMELE